MLNVVCVLKTGGDYGPDHVKKLYNDVINNLRVPHRFICVTDDPSGVPCDALPLRHGWPGWWSKIELFRSDLLPSGPKMYLDLDTRVVRSISDIVLGHKFTVLTNFWSDERIGSGLMAWDTDLSAIYRSFCIDPERFMAEYTTTERWGDQGFIRFNTPVPMERWQQKFPGRVVSFKRHCVPNNGVPLSASIVCFHGQPRPWQMSPKEKRWFDAGAFSEKVSVANSRA